MLTTAHAVLPAADLGRLRGFYHDKLGLDPAETREGTLLYGDGAAAFEVYETPNAGTAQNTQMSWKTDDLDAEMARLREAGVEFMDFEDTGVPDRERRRVRRRDALGMVPGQRGRHPLREPGPLIGGR